MSRYARWLPTTGILAVVALASTGLIAPPPPVAGAPAADITAYFAVHRLGLEIESLADGIGVTLLVVFAATFHSRVRNIPSLTVFGSAGIVAACSLVQVAVFEALTFRPNPDPTRAALLNDLQSFTFQVTTFPLALFLIAACVAIFASSVLPRWLGLAAAAAAVLQVAAWISFFAPSGILAAGGLPNIVSFAALLAWLVACSVMLLEQSRRSASG